MITPINNRYCPNNTINGFTLIELVMVIVLVGILSVVAMPRFADNSFDERGFRDAVKSVLQHARHVAVASRRFVCVDVDQDAGIISLTRHTDLPDGETLVSCNQNLTLPSFSRGCSASHQVCAPNGVVIGGTTNLIFDPLGRVISTPGNVTVDATFTITNQPIINVFAETGYIE